MVSGVKRCTEIEGNDDVVRAVRGILMTECANLYKSMKIDTLIEWA